MTKGKCGLYERFEVEVLSLFTIFTKYIYFESLKLNMKFYLFIIIAFMILNIIKSNIFKMNMKNKIMTIKQFIHYFIYQSKHN